MSQPLPRYLPNQQAQWEHKLARILLQIGEPAPTTTSYHATLAGDQRRLRGIPCIARGVTGTIPGTAPSDSLR